VKIITDCPVVLGEWKLSTREAVRWDNPEPVLDSVWQALAAGKDAWTLDVNAADDAVLILVEKSAESQFDQLVELTRAHAELPDTLICVALEGENFHGQSERPWTAVRGNLHLSFYSRLGITAADLQEEISILPTLALLDAFGIKANADEHTGIRWLNDLFVKGRKVAGTIAASQLEGNQIESVVYGIGVNVEVVPEVSPNPCVPAAASLRSTLADGGWTVAKAAMALVASLDRRLHELRGGIGEQMTKVYSNYSACIGQRVRIWPRKVQDFATTKPDAMGKLLAIHHDLTLTIEGIDEPVRDGRLAFEEDCRELGL